MATAAQITANRANAAQSTGPVTPEGKSRVSQNALKHGLTAKHLVIRPDQQEEFAALRDSLAADLDPQGALETITFNELLHAAWNLHRFRCIETDFCSGSPEDFLRSEITSVLDRLARYQARAQRAYYRALQELRTLQTNRAVRQIKLDPQTARRLPALADIDKLTKQTRSGAPAEVIQMALRTPDPEDSAVDLESLSLRNQECEEIAR
jgi:hypothetical protein